MLGCLVSSGAAAAPRGLVWGALLGAPAGLYCCFTLPYGGGLVAGPLLGVAGPLLGGWIAFHVGAAVGLHRAGHRWAILLVLALAAATVAAPCALFLDP